MVIVISALSILTLILIIYIFFLQLQLKNINRQLSKRLEDHTRQPISLELINSELNRLAVNINKCFKVEETLRLNVVRDEKRFKEIIANISHDLRTPLTAIKGYQQLLAREDLSDKQKERLQVAQKHAQKLGDLIEHFFRYSYLMDLDDINLKQINLTNIVAECIADNVDNIEAKGILVDFDLNESVLALADADMVVRIVQNLLRNSILHSIGDITIKVTKKDVAVIEVMNSIKENSQIEVNRLFDRFYTSDKARSRSTGLGLSIVKLLTEKMNGKVYADIHSNIFRICVELPLMKSHIREN
ncbi:HAMP domain-containing sensor histidine kinase [Clostridiaceae bacterium M8S5]|nr:HAMP domain-containing sensor histidine kinase [Clostridiaceae bacterium M8S5]